MKRSASRSKRERSHRSAVSRKDCRVPASPVRSIVERSCTWNTADLVRQLWPSVVPSILEPPRCRAAFLLFALALSGCSAIRSFSSPEGTGERSSAERKSELAELTGPSGFWTASQKHEAVPKESASGGVTTEQPAPTPKESERPGLRLSPLDLATALDLAATGNRRIAATRAEVRAAAAGVAVVRGTLLPKTTASGRYDWYSSDQQVVADFPPGILPPGVPQPEIIIQAADFGLLNSRLALPIDLSGELWATLRAAQAGYRGAKAQAWATTLEQQLAVLQAYYGLLEAEQLVAVSDQTIESYAEQLRQARLRVGIGRTTRNEMLIVEVALAEAEQERLRRRLAVKELRRRLNEAVGLEISSPTPVVDVRVFPDLPPVEEALRLAQSNNPLLTALLEDRTRLLETETALQRSRLPLFSGGAQAAYNSSGLFEPDLLGGGFVGLEWDLGTDLQRESRIAEVRAQLERVRLVLEGELRALEAGVLRACEAVEERLAAYRTAEVAVGQAEENLRIRSRQLEAGRADSEDILIAESLLSRQRAVLATALYAAHIRRGELQRLIGLPIDGVLSGPNEVKP